MRAVGRGTLVLRIPALVAGCEIGQRAYVLASRRNHFASLAARNYDWCDTFSREASCDGASTIEVTLSCSAWVWEPSEVHVIVSPSANDTHAQNRQGVCVSGDSAA